MLSTETCVDVAEWGLLQDNYNFNNSSNPARRPPDISIHLSPAIEGEAVWYQFSVRRIFSNRIVVTDIAV